MDQCQALLAGNSFSVFTPFIIADQLAGAYTLHLCTCALSHIKFSSCEPATSELDPLTHYEMLKLS